MLSLNIHNLAHSRGQRLLLTASCLVLGGVLSPSTLAQETNRDSWAKDSVVVTGEKDSITAPNTATATRTDTPIEKVPQSIQILTRTLIEEQDLQTVSDALTNISGVVPSKTSEIVLQSPVIRGFTTDYLVDGLPAYGLPTGIVDPGSLVNVERLEVAKGPTSTLYGGGRGAPLSGIINFVSKSPETERHLDVSLRAGSYNTLGATADLNLPASETLLFRVTGAYEQADSFIDVINSERYSIYPTASLAISDATRLTLRGQYSRIEQMEYAGLPSDIALANTGTVDRYTFAGAEHAPPTTIENTILTALLTHAFSDTLKAEVTARHYESRFKELSSFPFPAVPVAGTTYGFFTASLPSDVDQDFGSATLQSKFKTGDIAHLLLAGVDLDQTDYVAQLGFAPLGFIDYADPSTNLPFGAPATLTDIQTDAMSTTAIFVQDQVSIGNQLDITAGLRWTKLDVQSSYISGGIPFVDTDNTYYRVTPRLGATFEISSGLSAFAGYSEGFQGVVAAFGVTNPKPETSQSYEAGLKFFSPLPGLTGTIAAYQVTRQNVRTADPSNPFSSIQAGEQRARGLETDLVYEPTPALSLLATYAYTDAEVTKDNALPVGDRPARVPEHSGRVAVRYRFLEGGFSGLEIGGGLTAVSDRELTLPNVTSVDGSVLIDAQASYDFGLATVSLSVVNLTDEESFEPYQYLAASIVTPTQPRSAFVTLRRRF
jgi:iron complex outermembrane recepter protein